MSARDEAEQRFPIYRHGTVSDVLTSRSRDAFAEGAEWQREQDYAETPERIERMAVAIFLSDGGDFMFWEGDANTYRKNASAALATLRGEQP